MPMLPWPVWPLAEHARLGQNTVVGSMTVLLVVLGSMPRGVCLDPRFLYKYASPQLNAELPEEHKAQHIAQHDWDQRPQRAHIGTLGHLHIQHHDGDEDGQDP